MKAQDTSELFFEDVRIPATNMLGRRGQRLCMMMTKLPQERLAHAIRAATVTEAVIDWTVEYTAGARPSASRSRISRTPSSSSPR